MTHLEILITYVSYYEVNNIDYDINSNFKNNIINILNNRWGQNVESFTLR